MSKVKFNKGLKANLPSSGLVSGQYYQCTDTGELFLATSETTLIQVGKNTEELEQIISYAMNELNRRFNELSFDELELIISSALNDLEQRKLINNIAPEFHTWDDAVPVGGLRVYKGVLYRCVVATTKGRPFTPSEWVRTTIAEEMITSN